MDWLCLRTGIAPRSEFAAMFALQQQERQAIVPFEEKWVRKGNTKLRQAKKYPLFPRYCFSQFEDWDDYERTTRAINNLAIRMGKAPPILGALRLAGSQYLAKLTPTELSWIQGLSTPRPTEINLHRALQRGGKVNIMEGPFSGYVAQVDAVSRKNVTVMLQMFNSMQVVKLPMAAVEAA